MRNAMYEDRIFFIVAFSRHVTATDRIISVCLRCKHSIDGRQIWDSQPTITLKRTPTPCAFSFGSIWKCSELHFIIDFSNVNNHCDTNLNVSACVFTYIAPFTALAFGRGRPIKTAKFSLSDLNAALCVCVFALCIGSCQRCHPHTQVDGMVVHRVKA